MRVESNSCEDESCAIGTIRRYPASRVLNFTMVSIEELEECLTG